MLKYSYKRKIKVCFELGKKASQPKQWDKHFGFRVCCITIVWFVLGGTLVNSENQNTFFSTLILYLLPLTLDYNSHMPLAEKNKKRQNIGLWSTLGLAALFVGIMFSGFNVEFLVLNNWVQFITWLLCVFYVYLAIVDWITYSSPEETAHRESIKKAHRERTEHETMTDRVEYYKRPHKKPTGTYSD
jgi:small-conductance mechanosensitive channel